MWPAEMQRDDCFRLNEDPAADRRRDLQPRAHRGEDRAALRRPGRLRARRLAQRRRVQRSAQRRARRGLCRRTERRLRARAHAAREQEARRRWSRWRQARANKTPIDWSPTRRRRRSSPAGACSATRTWPNLPPASTGGRSSRPGTWRAVSRSILRDEVVGHEAQRVFSDGKRLLQRAIEGRWLQANGVIALLPANTVDDDTIEVYTDENAQPGGAALEPAAPADACGR